MDDEHELLYCIEKIRAILSTTDEYCPCRKARRDQEILAMIQETLNKTGIIM